MNELEKVREHFSADIFASSTVGITIEAAAENYAECSFVPGEKHINAAGVVMGAAVYALADFCFAVASNYASVVSDGDTLTQTLSSQISYLSAAKKGVCLVAEAECIKNGRTTCYYNVRISERDNPSRVIAAAAVNGINLTLKK